MIKFGRIYHRNIKRVSLLAWETAACMHACLCVRIAAGDPRGLHALPGSCCGGPGNKEKNFER